LYFSIDAKQFDPVHSNDCLQKMELNLRATVFWLMFSSGLQDKVAKTVMAGFLCNNQKTLIIIVYVFQLFFVTL